MRYVVKEQLSREEGFTLPEVLVTTVMMIIVLFALYSIFDMGLRVFSFSNDKVEAIENARLGMEKMEREIRAAYPYTKLDGSSANDYLFLGFGASPSNPVTPNPSTSLTFSNDLDGDWQVDTDAATEQISYSLSGGSQPTLLRNGQPLVEFVKPGGLSFTLCKTANDCPPASPINEGEVRLVRIQLTIEVKRGFQTGTQTLTTDVALRNRGE